MTLSDSPLGFRKQEGAGGQLSLSGSVPAICLPTVAVFLVMNLFTCIWNPVAAYFDIRDFLFNIVTTVVTGGVAMVIFFAVDKIVFAPGWDEKK